MATVEAKRGDTIVLDCTWKNDDGTPLNLTGWTISASAKHTSGVTQAFTPTIVDAVNGLFSLSIDAATSAGMPIGDWSVDIQRADAAGTTQSSETFTLALLEDITP